jgi:hypothetical protein
MDLDPGDNGALARPDDILLQLADSAADEYVDKKIIDTEKAFATIADLFHPKILKEFKLAFKNNEDMPGFLSAEPFKALIASYIAPSEVESTYRKIDVNNDGFIDFSQFTSFLITSEAELAHASKSNSVRLVQQEVDVDAMPVVHRDMIDHMCYFPKPANLVVAASRDGLISISNPYDLGRVSTIAHRGKNTVFVEGLRKVMSTEQKAKVRMATKDQREAPPKRVPITALAAMIDVPYIIVGSADSSITVYELMTGDVCGRIVEMMAYPTVITTFKLSSRVEFKTRYNIYISFGDSEGTVHMLRLDSDFGVSQDAGARKRNSVLFAQAESNAATFYRTKIHTDWVTGLKYVDELRVLISSSLDGKARPLCPFSVVRSICIALFLQSHRLRQCIEQ